MKQVTWNTYFQQIQKEQFWEAESFSNYLKSQNSLSNGTYYYLVDEKGNIIYHPDTEKVEKSVENSEVKGVINRLSKGEKVKGTKIEYIFRGNKSFGFKRSY